MGQDLKTLPLAGAARRVVAYAADLSLILLVHSQFLCLWLLAVYMEKGKEVVPPLIKLFKTYEDLGLLWFGLYALLGNWLTGLMWLVGICLISIPIYFGYFESKFGQTPGKKCFGLFVCRQDGARPSVLSAVVRDLFRYLEGGLFLPAFVMLGFTTEKRRLGDRLAGTIVVYDQSHDLDGDFHYIPRKKFLEYFKGSAIFNIPEDIAADLLFHVRHHRQALLKDPNHLTTRWQQIGKYVPALTQGSHWPVEPIERARILAEVCLQAQNQEKLKIHE